MTKKKLTPDHDDQPLVFEERDLPLGFGREELEKIYSWNLEDAIKATLEWNDSTGKRMPVSQWTSSRRLKSLSDKYAKKENKSLILEALYLCLFDDLPVPQWCMFGYLESWRTVQFKRETSWDDVFGKPHPKGTHKGDTRNDMFRVYRRVKEIKEESPKTPIGIELFERVGRELGIGGKTRTSDLYYRAKAWWDSLEKQHSDSINEMLKIQEDRE